MSIISLDINAQSLNQLENKAIDTSNVLAETMKMADNSIPQELLERAVCVATIPDIIHIGFVFGARYGMGLVSCRVPEGWSRPSFLSVKGGSWGAQIGVASVDLILVFTRPNAVEKFSKNNFTIGLDATVAAGPVGRNAELGTDYRLDSEIYSYSRARGVFIGPALKGTLLKINDKDNTKIYGTDIKTKDILITRGDRSPWAVMPYVYALMTYAP